MNELFRRGGHVPDGLAGLLAEWEPRRAIRRPVSDVRRLAVPAVDVHNHLGRAARRRVRRGGRTRTAGADPRRRPAGLLRPSRPPSSGPPRGRRSSTRTSAAPPSTSTGRRGDEGAQRARARFAGYLAAAVRMLVPTVDAHLVLGGGVAEVCEPLPTAVADAALLAGEPVAR